MSYRLGLLFALLLVFAPYVAHAQTQSDFFDTNKLQEIRLDIFPKDWALLKEHFLENTRYAGEFHWSFNGKEVPLSGVSIRSRGKGSRSGVKPSLKVEFDFYESKQTFLGLKTIVLRANTQDASMMHERVAMELFRKMGLPVPRETHTKLYVNDEYVGLYTIVEAIDKSFLRSAYNEDTGYLYNYQWDGFLFEDRGPNPAAYSPVPFEPEFNSQTPNPAPIASMVQTINMAPDSQFQSAVSQYVDLNDFMTQIAAENYLAEQDGLIGDYGLNNFYLYRFAGRNQHTFIPWDKSNTFFLSEWPVMRNIQSNVLSRRAAAVPELMAIYRSTLVRAAEIAGGPGGWLEQEINKQYQQIQQAAYADPLKLCDPGATGVLRPCSNAEFDAEVARMIQFVRNRPNDVLTQLNSDGINQQNFTITNLGGFSSTATGAANSMRVGYARIQSSAGSTTPSGLAIFSLRNGDMVVTEAGVPASPLVQSGRIYAEVNGGVNTGLAVANPNDQSTNLTFYFTDSAGRDFNQGMLTIPANGQIAQFLDTAPFNSGTLTSGTFTFASSLPVAAIALRGLTNERSEFLITTLPVTPTTGQSGNLVFPHFADGGGWTTQVVLVNPTEQTLTGTVQFFSQGSAATAGQALVVATLDTPPASSFNYSIPAHASFRVRTAGGSPEVRAGTVRVTAAAGSSTPSGVGIFSFRNVGVTVTEAGVPAMRATSAFRLYAESSGDFAHSQVGSIQTGIAVANSAASPATVIFELTGLDGTSTGLTGSANIPANGQTSLFLYQVPGLTGISTSFQGVLRISGPPTIAVVGLRGRYNERGDFLITTTPPVPEDEPATAAELLFPHIVEGAGYTTQFILFSGKPAQASSGTVRYLSQTGQPLTLSIR